MKTTIAKPAVVAPMALLLLALGGCGPSAEPPVAENPALTAPVPAGMLRGTVAETMDSGGYTYVFIDTGTEQRWVATQQTPVSVGDVVLTDQGMPMTGFTSRTLGKTFDVIYFVGGLQNLSAPPAPTAQPASGLPEGNPATALPPGHPETDGSSGSAAVAADVAAVEPGKDIAWVYANKDALAGQSVTLRGQVVKYNAGILGWNFIHLQDGSGDAAAGTNDLTVTSHGEAAVGSTVVVTGPIVLDKDFGAGYTFPVLMEDAAVTAE